MCAVLRPEVASPMDTLNPAERSERMRRIRSEDTAPEMVVRRLVHRMGYRYRLHARGLPGVPDLVFKGRGKIILVHGCFWHLHRACHQTRVPKSRWRFGNRSWRVTSEETH